MIVIPHQQRDPRWHGYGIAIFSKQPFDWAESIPLTKEAIDNPASVVSVQIDDQQLRIMAVHVMSPINLYRLELRNRQFKEIADLVRDDPTPTILVGDMNCSTSSNYLADLIDETNLRIADKDLDCSRLACMGRRIWQFQLITFLCRIQFMSTIASSANPEEATIVQ